MDKTLTAYEKVVLARSRKRWHINDFIDELFTGFIELKGDRLNRDDPAVIGGIAFFHDIPVTVIGNKKGSTTEENLKCSFGMASPEGYRKALRLMKQAERFSRPVITFIDTPGAHPGMEAESSGQASAIAGNLAAMSALKMPVIAVITGEGSSGGALALALADRVYMLENAIYSILSPEGFASILWRDPSKVEKASELMKLTAQDTYGYGLIDGVVSEQDLFQDLDQLIYKELMELKKLPADQLVELRYRKYRAIDGQFRPFSKKQNEDHNSEKGL